MFTVRLCHEGQLIYSDRRKLEAVVITSFCFGILVDQLRPNFDTIR
jgi:hypothetical protein